MTSLPPKDRGCHRTGFKKNCRDLVASGRCARWYQIQGTNPNTGEPVNEYKCIDDWLPMLLLENSQLQRQTGASCDKVATEVRNFKDKMVEQNRVLLDGASRALPPPDHDEVIPTTKVKRLE